MAIDKTKQIKYLKDKIHQIEKDLRPILLLPTNKHSERAAKLKRKMIDQYRNEIRDLEKK